MYKFIIYSFDKQKTIYINEFENFVINITNSLKHFSNVDKFFFKIREDTHKKMLFLVVGPLRV